MIEAQGWRLFPVPGLCYPDRAGAESLPGLNPAL